MPHSKWLSLLFVAAFGAGLLAQPKTFKARLSPVPIDIAMQANVAGSGSISAVLTGTKLAITGTFEGLREVNTTGSKAEGPVVSELTVTKGSDPTAGTIAGNIDLTALQVADFEKGRLYVQLHSEKAPEGNLWGWILPQETRR